MANKLHRCRLNSLLARALEARPVRMGYYAVINEPRLTQINGAK